MRRRVIFFDAYPHVFTGAQRATLLLAQELSERGWQPELVATAGGPFVDATRAAGIASTIFPVPAPLQIYGHRTEGARAVAAAAALPMLWARLARWLRTRADLVHIADHRGMILAGPAARLARIPAVWHIHALNPSPVLNRAGALMAHRTIVPTSAVIADMSGLESRRACAVVPYALPPALLAPPSPRPPGHPFILTAGRIHPDKGLDILLRAVALIVPRRPTLKVLVAGAIQEGLEDHHTELLQLRSRLGLDHVVDLPGYVDDIRALMTHSTMYVQPSRPRTEIQPIAVLEAMAAGVPIVATAVGGVPEMLGGGRRGLLVAPEDPFALARAMETLLDDGAGGEKRSEEAGEWVRSICAIEDMVDRVLRVYAPLTTASASS